MSNLKRNKSGVSIWVHICVVAYRIYLNVRNMSVGSTPLRSIKLLIPNTCIDYLKLKMMKLTITLFFTLLSNLILAQRVIQLYDGKPKGSENWTWNEATSTKNMFNTEVVYNVSQPTITAYLPPKDLATGTAIIVAPGGAFHTLSINSEGTDVAKWLNSKGIAAFVLKYRLARSFTEDPVKETMSKMGDFKKLDEENAPIVPLAMADGLAAVQYVRDHA
ncbi:MAG: hypothetical protein MUF58_21455, partial [Arcicella sp.]|nr:hypothetical protein [Arcicella sp.]